MKKLALIMLAAASLLATAGLAPAQYYYGGGYYYPAIATVILASTIGTTMVDITVDEAMDMAEASSDITRGASEKCGIRLVELTAQHWAKVQLQNLPERVEGCIST